MKIFDYTNLIDYSLNRPTVQVFNLLHNFMSAYSLASFCISSFSSYLDLGSPQTRNALTAQAGGDIVHFTNLINLKCRHAVLLASHVNPFLDESPYSILTTTKHGMTQRLNVIKFHTIQSCTIIINKDRTTLA